MRCKSDAAHASMGTACKCCLANNFKKPFIHNTETAHLPLNHGIPNKHQAKQIPCSVDNWLETLFKSHVIPCGLGLLCDFPLVLQIAWRNTRNWQSSPSAPISHPGQRKKKMIWPKTKTANYFSGKSNSKNSLDSKSHENTPINANQWHRNMWQLALSVMAMQNQRTTRTL